MKEMLKLRKKQKAKKPDFLRPDYQKRACVPLRWRKPHGLHSKVRHRFAGHTAMPDPGFGSPKDVYGLHPSGLAPVLVHTLNELAKVNAKTQGAVLGSTLGVPRRMALLLKAKELGVRVLNAKDIDAKLKELQEGLAARRETKAKLAKDKAAKTQEKEKAATKKSELAQKVTDEERKKEEKAEKDKVLTASK
jgi:large subunit ribosomal protein L32e